MGRLLVKRREGRQAQLNLDKRYRVMLGALYLAARSNRAQVNAALARTCVIIWPYDGDAVFSAVVYDLALSMLRYGWRKGGDDELNFSAEMNSQVDPDCALPL